jgi:hypothetical protein
MSYVVLATIAAEATNVLLEMLTRSESESPRENSATNGTKDDVVTCTRRTPVLVAVYVYLHVSESISINQYQSINKIHSSIHPFTAQVVNDSITDQEQDSVRSTQQSHSRNWHQYNAHWQL